jgi:mono/diheme cytochrome c family protein
MNGQRRFVRRSSLVLSAYLVVSTSLVRARLASGEGSSASSPVASDVVANVTPVGGPSWIKHLNLPFEQTAMGRIGELGPLPPEAPSVRRSPNREAHDGGFVLTGADLYRLNCQPCHRSSGAGIPPEMPTLIDPVRATSAAWTETLMAKRGITMDPTMLRQMASQAESSLRQRVLQGGEKMPSFSDHLQEKDVDALISYLDILAGVAEGAKQVEVRESQVRVGEQLVKGTCRICHDATGQPIDASAMTRGVIPSLDSFVQQRTLREVIRKVREGAATEPERATGRGRMPVFSYLTDEEVTAAYVYLLLYPPGEASERADETSP